MPALLLADAQVATLLAAVSGQRSFSPSKGRLEELAASLSMSTDELSFVLAALSFLYDHLQALMKRGADFETAVEGVAADLEFDDKHEPLKPRLLPVLSALLKPQDVHERYKKIARLRGGLIPNAVGFSSFVDLRPSFEDQDHELSVTGYIPIIQFRVLTDSNDPTLRRITFQLTRDSLKELREALERVDKKLTSLHNQSSFSSLLVEF